MAPRRVPSRTVFCSRIQMRWLLLCSATFLFLAVNKINGSHESEELSPLMKNLCKFLMHLKRTNFSEKPGNGTIIKNDTRSRNRSEPLKMSSDKKKCLDNGNKQNLSIDNDASAISKMQFDNIEKSAEVQKNVPENDSQNLQLLISKNKDDISRNPDSCNKIIKKGCQNCNCLDAKNKNHNNNSFCHNKPNKSQLYAKACMVCTKYKRNQNMSNNMDCDGYQSGHESCDSKELCKELGDLVCKQHENIQNKPQSSSNRELNCTICKDCHLSCQKCCKNKECVVGPCENQVTNENEASNTTNLCEESNSTHITKCWKKHDINVLDNQCCELDRGICCKSKNISCNASNVCSRNSSKPISNKVSECTKSTSWRNKCECSDCENASRICSIPKNIDPQNLHCRCFRICSCPTWALNKIIRYCNSINNCNLCRKDPQTCSCTSCLVPTPRECERKCKNDYTESCCESSSLNNCNAGTDNCNGRLSPISLIIKRDFNHICLTLNDNTNPVPDSQAYKANISDTTIINVKHPSCKCIKIIIDPKCKPVRCNSDIICEESNTQPKISQAVCCNDSCSNKSCINKDDKKELVSNIEWKQYGSKLEGCKCILASRNNVDSQALKCKTTDQIDDDHFKNSIPKPCQDNANHYKITINNCVKHHNGSTGSFCDPCRCQKFRCSIRNNKNPCTNCINASKSGISEICGFPDKEHICQNLCEVNQDMNTNDETEECDCKQCLHESSLKKECLEENNPCRVPINLCQSDSCRKSLEPCQYNITTINCSKCPEESKSKESCKCKKECKCLITDSKNTSINCTAVSKLGLGKIDDSCNKKYISQYIFEISVVKNTSEDSEKYNFEKSTCRCFSCNNNKSLINNCQAPCKKNRCNCNLVDHKCSLNNLCNYGTNTPKPVNLYKIISVVRNNITKECSKKINSISKLTHKKSETTISDCNCACIKNTTNFKSGKSNVSKCQLTSQSHCSKCNNVDLKEKTEKCNVKQILCPCKEENNECIEPNKPCQSDTSTKSDNIFTNSNRNDKSSCKLKSDHCDSNSKREQCNSMKCKTKEPLCHHAKSDGANSSCECVEPTIKTTLCTKKKLRFISCHHKNDNISENDCDSQCSTDNVFTNSNRNDKSSCKLKSDHCDSNSKQEQCSSMKCKTKEPLCHHAKDDGANSSCECVEPTIKTTSCSEKKLRFISCHHKNDNICENDCDSQCSTDNIFTNSNRNNKSSCKLKSDHCDSNIKQEQCSSMKCKTKEPFCHHELSKGKSCTNEISEAYSFKKQIEPLRNDLCHLDLNGYPKSFNNMITSMEHSKECYYKHIPLSCRPRVRHYKKSPRHRLTSKRNIYRKRWWPKLAKRKYTKNVNNFKPKILSPRTFRKI